MALRCHNLDTFDHAQAAGLEGRLLAMVVHLEAQ